MKNAGKAGIRPRDGYDSSATYERLDAVMYNGTMYIAKKDVPQGTLPTDTEYWMKSITGGTSEIATTENVGIVKPDGTTITIDEDGTIHGQSKVDEMTGATADTDGSSGTVPTPLAGQQDLFLRGDGTWAKASGGSSIAPRATIDPMATNGHSEVTITWGDPEDIIYDGDVVLSEWKGTKLVMSETGYPANENDGVLILDNNVRNAYKTTGYVVDGLTNGKTYYFALFPYSTDGVYNYSASNRLLGNLSFVKLDSCTNMQISAAMGSVTVTWDDPDATKTVDGDTATWAKTVLVYKQGSVAPNSPADGTIAVTETTRNQYASAGYEVTGLTDGEQYTFSLFAVSTDEAPSDAVSATAKLWATLTVNTTEETLFGKTVTATNEVKTVSGTFSDSGSATLQIPWIGLTTVASTDGTDTADDTVDVTAYMDSYTVDITFTPVGETVTPVNDITILLKCAGIKDRTYATMSELLAANDTDAMLDITMSDNAMQYLARSTGFADEVCANENFMAYLGQSPSVEDTVLNSDIWWNKVCGSDYYNLVLVDLAPTMTSISNELLTLEPYYNDSTLWNDTLPWNIFDNNENTGFMYQLPANSGNYYLAINYNNTHKIGKIHIRTAGFSSGTWSPSNLVVSVSYEKNNAYESILSVTQAVAPMGDPQEKTVLCNFETNKLNICSEDVTKVGSYYYSCIIMEIDIYGR